MGPGTSIVSGEHASRRRRTAASQRGEALVEFAFASAIFFLTTFGTIEMGRAVWQYNMVSNLAQEGARWASVHGASSASPASAAAVQTFVNGRSLGLTVTVTTTPDPSAVTPGGTVTVAVSTAFAPLTGIAPINAMTLQSTASMIVFR